MAGKIETFISYADGDKGLLKELEDQLKPLERDNLINIWHKQQIIPGQEQQREIDKHLKAARLILLLVSPNYLASDHLYTHEVAQAMEYKKAGTAEVIPVLLRSVYWEAAPFGKLRPLPSDGQPVNRWPDRGEAFYDIVMGVRKIVQDLIAPLQTDPPEEIVMHNQPAPQEQPAFDVFLCHNSADKPAVKEVAEQLRVRGIKPWLDEWELQPGIPWQPPLEEQIRKIRSGAVFIGSQGIGPWQRQEVDAFIRRFVNNRASQNQVPVIPVFLKTAPKGVEVPVFLEGFGRVDFRQQSPDPIEQLVWGITGKNPHYHTPGGGQQPQDQAPAPKSMGLTTGQRQRLLQKLNETQKLWDLRNERVQRLKKALEVEPDVTVQLKYENQLAQAEAALADLTKELEEIEQTLQN